MANLLPLEFQNKLRRKTFARFTIAASFWLLVLAAVAMVALAPSFIAISRAPSAVLASTTPAASNAADLQKSADLVKAIGPILSAPSVLAIAQAAVAERPNGVIIEHISYTGGSPGQILLGGTANRDAVNAYRAILQSDGRFSAVYVPVAVLVGSSDGTFSITLNLK